MATPPFLIDAHSHINFNAYRDDAPEVIARAEAEDIGMLAVGSQINTSRRAVEYAERYPHVWAVVGLHPMHLIDTHVDLAEVGEAREGIAFRTRPEVFDGAAYRALAEHPRVVGIGECGLDFYRIPEGCIFEEVLHLQEATFRHQIALAQALDLPLMVHVRDGGASAHDATLRILADTRDGWHRDLPFGMIHCYSGTWDQGQRYLALGFNLSFTGIITFRPTTTQLPVAEELARVVRAVPLDRFHVETDCPYLTPEPHRGERNEPRYVRHVAEKIAALWRIPLAEVAHASVENTLRLFRKIRW